MTAKESVCELLARPRLRQHFTGEVGFADLLSALEEFGEPRFTLRGQQSFCEVSLPGSEGSVTICGQTDVAANPSGAGLACLLALLQHLDSECERGLNDICAHLQER